MPTVDTVDAFIFYFDLVGVVDRYATNPGVLDEITQFQRRVRELPTGFGEPYSVIVTAFDNVLARVNVEDCAGTANYKIVEFAADTLRLAEEAGFNTCFGAVTQGTVEIDPFDQTLIAGRDATDLRSQHLSFMGNAHVRAAFAEKWSAELAKKRVNPFGANCVWVGEEVFDPRELPGLAAVGDPSVRVLKGVLDLRTASRNGHQWPFELSKFSGIRPR